MPVKEDKNAALRTEVEGALRQADIPDAMRYEAWNSFFANSEPEKFRDGLNSVNGLPSSVKRQLLFLRFPEAASASPSPAQSEPPNASQSSPRQSPKPQAASQDKSAFRKGMESAWGSIKAGAGLMTGKDFGAGDPEHQKLPDKYIDATGKEVPLFDAKGRMKRPKDYRDLLAMGKAISEANPVHASAKDIPVVGSVIEAAEGRPAEAAGGLVGSLIGNPFPTGLEPGPPQLATGGARPQLAAAADSIRMPGAKPKLMEAGPPKPIQHGRPASEPVNNRSGLALVESGKPRAAEDAPLTPEQAGQKMVPGVRRTAMESQAKGGEPKTNVSRLQPTVVPAETVSRVSNIFQTAKSHGLKSVRIILGKDTKNPVILNVDLEHDTPESVATQMHEDGVEIGTMADVESADRETPNVKWRSLIGNPAPPGAK